MTASFRLRKVPVEGSACIHIYATFCALAHWVFWCFAFSLCTKWNSKITYQPFFSGSLLDQTDSCPRHLSPSALRAPRAPLMPQGKPFLKPQRQGSFFPLLFGCQGPKGLTDSGVQIALSYSSLLFMSFLLLICLIDGRETFICQIGWGPSWVIWILSPFSMGTILRALSFLFFIERREKRHFLFFFFFYFKGWL